MFKKRGKICLLYTSSVCSKLIVVLTDCLLYTSGEAEVIALALEKKTDLVLLDEKEAREVAERLGFRVLGTVGLRCV